MDQLSLCWRGMAGTGKRTELMKALKGVADMRGVPFSIQMRIDTDIGAGAEGDDAPDTGQFMHEVSLVHIGLDVARMSMQDKNILRPIFAKLGKGSHVLVGKQGRGHRILVLYHAHLLSSESVLLLHSCLEQNEGDVSIWLTSELPTPYRIRDWFIEVPTSGADRTFETFAQVSQSQIGWPDIFRAIIDRWSAADAPKIGDIKEVKAYVYEMLMRNLRWVEATHYMMDAVLNHDGINREQRVKCMAALAACDATGGGYTIPSYRIPILWENLLIEFRSILSKVSVQEVDARPKRVIIKRKKRVGDAATKVASV